MATDTERRETSDELKRRAACLAADRVASGMLVGLGTGSTAAHAIRRLGERVRGEGLQFRAVPMSEASATLAREVGIELVELEAGARIDYTIDGADEVDRDGNLIKGGGGALLREKVVAHRSDEVAIVVDPSKLVETLGRSFRLPVEVVPFARCPVADEIQVLGGVSELRMARETPFRTDNGNWILDVAFADGIDAPRDLESRLDRIPGVVESGIFVGLADRVIVGRPGAPEVRELAR